MKNTRLFYILFCTISMLMISACETAEIQSANKSKESPISSRGDCDDCPDPDVCCCSIELDDTGPSSILICGAEDGTTSCPGTIPCWQTVSFNNLSRSWTLTSTFPIQDFCMQQGSGFYILNQGNATTVNVTCQRGQMNPQTVNLPLGAGAKAYYSVNSSCEIEPCP